MAPRQESNSFSALFPAAAPPTVIGRLEEFRGQRWSRKARRTKHGRRYDDYYSEEECETADALILLSLSRGGFCASSKAAESASYIDSGDIENTAADKMLPAVAAVSTEEKNPLLLRRRVQGKVEKQILHKCDRQFSSPETLGGESGDGTGHRFVPTTEGSNLVPDLNVALRVFECSKCHNAYDSGPALGGHKRKHYNVDNASASSGCGIDLNLPPVLDDD